MTRRGSRHLALLLVMAMGSAAIPSAAVAQGDANADKQALEGSWEDWVRFERTDNLLVHFSHIIDHRCGIKQVRYSVNSETASGRLVIPPCGLEPTEASLYRMLPPSAERISLQITYADGTTSETRVFDVPR